MNVIIHRFYFFFLSGISIYSSTHSLIVPPPMCLLMSYLPSGENTSPIMHPLSWILIIAGGRSYKKKKKKRTDFILFYSASNTAGVSGEGKAAAHSACETLGQRLAILNLAPFYHNSGVRTQNIDGAEKNLKNKENSQLTPGSGHSSKPLTCMNLFQLYNNPTALVVWFTDEGTKYKETKLFAHSHIMVELATKNTYSTATLKYFSRDGC